MDAEKEMFERFRQKGLSLIELTKEEQWSENLHLDFKGVYGRDEQPCDGNGKMTAAGRKILAEALSGFANSEGGLIIWGIDCRKDEDGLDVVQELNPVPCVRRFEAELQTYTPNIVSPAVAGVVHHVIETENERGYIVSYIPQSDGQPHMAIAKDQHRYYVRSGCSFLKMEHFMVADRFGRRPNPDLKLYLRIPFFAHASQNGIDYSAPENSMESRAVVGIHNAGRGLARFPALRINPPANGADVSHRLEQFPNRAAFGLPLVNEANRYGRGLLLAGGSDRVIHSRATLEVGILHFWYDTKVQSPIVIPLDYELYCDGFSLQTSADISLDGIDDETTLLI